MEDSDVTTNDEESGIIADGVSRVGRRLEDATGNTEGDIDDDESGVARVDEES